MNPLRSQIQVNGRICGLPSSERLCPSNERTLTDGGWMNLARCIVFNAMLTNGSARKEMATGGCKSPIQDWWAGETCRSADMI